jgi:hypothetical protein
VAGHAEPLAEGFCRQQELGEEAEASEGEANAGRRGSDA